MIEKLQMFLALVRERHFGRAAESCGVTQPSLSSAIRQLEEQLGVQLVHRGSRYQGLTPEGQKVHERAVKILADVRALRDEMRAAHLGLAGHVRLGVIPSALPMVAELTRPFIARHPAVSFSIYSRTSAEILSGIESLSLDAGITYLDNEPLGRVSRAALYRESYRFLCAKDSPEAAAPSLTWAEAAQLPLCLLTPDMQNRRIIDEHLGPRRSAAIESNSSIVLASHVISGAWASIVSDHLASLFASWGTLASVALVEPQITHTVGLITARHDPQTPILAALIEEAQRYHAKTE